MQGTKAFQFIYSVLLWHLVCFKLQATVQENIQGAKLNDTSNSPERGQQQHFNNPSNNAIKEEHSHKTHFSDEQGYHYFLPKQTVFDSPVEVITSMVISTSPPKLTIKPSPVQQSISFTNTAVRRKDAKAICSLQPEACISETRTFPFVASSFSPDLQVPTNKAVVMHGRMETASSTESENNIFENSRIVSQPSTVLLHGINAKDTAGMQSAMFSS